ncbi:MAG: DNA-3-methyladenine glycosylase [Anaerolineales bacterium]
MTKQLPREFYTRDTLTIARELLGKCLVRRFEGQRLAGYITEVEAYIGEEDEACHACSGKTERTTPMYGPPGRLYVYLIYGMYHCLNIVSEPEGFPAAILVRALRPTEGVATMRRLRGAQHADRDLARGPGRLCEALAVDRSFNHACLYAEDARLWLEQAPAVPADEIARSPRINVRGDERARTVRWRFYLRDSRWVSGKRAFNHRYAPVSPEDAAP